MCVCVCVCVCECVGLTIDKLAYPLLFFQRLYLKTSDAVSLNIFHINFLFHFLLTVKLDCMKKMKLLYLILSAGKQSKDKFLMDPQSLTALLEKQNCW